MLDPAYFEYSLPPNLIANLPVEPRDSCKLMVIDRISGGLEHKKFADIGEILNPGDVLVFNNSKVFPARLFGQKLSGGKVEILLLEEVGSEWRAIGRGVKAGTQVIFDHGLGAEIVSQDEEGQITVRFNKNGVELKELIEKIGNTPIPPYIKSMMAEADLRKAYQTVYAKEEGSAAAPTAGLHFTEELINRLIQKGVMMENIWLHVGLGTFKPLTEENIKSGKLHHERYFIDEDSAKRLNEYKKTGRRIFAVGTTTMRTLESATDENGVISPGERTTNIFIYPPYKFKFTDKIITNFHLPQSSLLMLITAICSPKVEISSKADFEQSLAGKAYREAVEKEYRFFSFGDAMIIS